MIKKLLICLVCVFMFSAVFCGVSSQMKQTIQIAYAASDKIEVSAAVADTKEVQTRLKTWGYYTGAIDGINGPQTIAAVKKFQKKYGLTQDGIVGPLTAAKMGISVKGGTSSSSYSSNDRYLLAKVIYAEARGESYTGQVAIGAVVLPIVRKI